MVNSVVQFITTTVAIIFAAVIGITSGASATVTDVGIIVESPRPIAIAFGDFAFHYRQDRIAHEVGHLAIEDDLGVAYLPTMILGIGHVLLMRQYVWPETWADELGGVARGVR